MLVQSDAALSDRMPTTIEQDSANQLRRIIAGLARDGDTTPIHVALGDGQSATLTLAPAVTETLLDVLRMIASGRGFRLVPVNAQLTTQQAADLLNVSRPHLVKLLETGVIPFTKTGRHRRLRAEDVFAYKAKRDEARAEALAAMAADDAALGDL